MKWTLLMSFGVLAVLTNGGGAQEYRVDPKDAMILQEARYLSGDGSFGSAYVQNDGTEFKEETQADGTRKGQYSYIDTDGKKITVQYTAGKSGFQVSGDHLPKAPQPMTPLAPQQQYRQTEPVPQYNVNPQYNSIPQQSGSGTQQFGYSFGTPQPQLHQQSQQQFGSGSNFNHNSYKSNNGFSQFPTSNNFQQIPVTTTPAPHRYFSPGKLNLNRTPDGYQYSFTSN